MGRPTKAVLSVVAAMLLPPHTTALPAPATPGVEAGTRQVQLEVHRARTGGMRIRAGTDGLEPPGAEAPEAFWIAFYNSVTDALFAATERPRGRRGGIPMDSQTRLDLLCRKQAQELAQWPVDALAARIAPTAEQKQHLDALRDATMRAQAGLAAACEEPPPAGTLQRLAEVEHRLRGMLQAAEAIRPALKALVDHLDPEGRRRFELLGHGRQPRNGADQERALAFCHALVGARRVDRFARALLGASRPRREQARAVNEVMAAAMRGHRLLHESCALDRSGDPLMQLEVMRQRLQMSADAVEGLRSALDDYHDSLDARQKRRFARLGYGIGEARASARR
jgi:hypothetical protein